MKFIIFNGCSCSGKSTIIKNILNQREKCYHLSEDSLKWQFSQFKPDVHSDDVTTLLNAVAESICNMKYDILCDTSRYRKNREELLKVPRKHNYEVIEINLDVDYEILEKRFDERVAKALVSDSKRIRNTSKERFKEIYDNYQNDKNNSAISFKTDEQDVDLITAEVLKLF